MSNLKNYGLQFEIADFRDHRGKSTGLFVTLCTSKIKHVIKMRKKKKKEKR